VSVRIVAGRPSVFLSLTLAALLFGPVASHGSPPPAKAPRSAAKHAAPRGAKRPVTPPFFSGEPDTAQFRASAEAGLKQAQDTIDRLLAVQGPRTVENTLTLYNEAMAHGENVAYQSHLMEAVHPDSAYRASAEGPGVAPDVMWQGDAPGSYDASADATANAALKALGDPHCRPN